MAVAQRIDGKAAAEQLHARVSTAVARLVPALGRAPGLAVVRVGEDPASAVYVRTKLRQTTSAGMVSIEHHLPETVSTADVLAVVGRLNADPAVDGILVQLPLPAPVDAAAVIAAIDPAKDVDGFHVVNAGRLATGQFDQAFIPCTPLGCLILLRATLGSLSGLSAVVIGRSNIVGKPMAHLLLAQDCTVTLAHSRSRDLPAIVAQADIVVAAVGRPELVRGSWIKPGATVIDVGINRVATAEGHRLVGDVAFEEAAAVAGAITPVPGGVGPMTVACLLRNTVVAACRRAGLPEPEELAL